VSDLDEEKIASDQEKTGEEEEETPGLIVRIKDSVVVRFKWLLIPVTDEIRADAEKIKERAKICNMVPKNNLLHLLGFLKNNREIKSRRARRRMAKKTLGEAGWSSKDIREAFRAIREDKKEKKE